MILYQAWSTATNIVEGNLLKTNRQLLNYALVQLPVLDCCQQQAAEHLEISVPKRQTAHCSACKHISHVQISKDN
jgi:hypothetical protein